MSIERTRLAVISFLTLLVVLFARESQAGFIRPQATPAMHGIRGGVVWSLGTSEDTVPSPELGRVCRSGPGMPAADEETDDRLAIQNLPGILASSEGACGAVPSSQSAGASFGSLAICDIGMSIHDSTISARLSGEIGIRFSNPPPWTLLRPPCQYDVGDCDVPHTGW